MAETRGARRALDSELNMVPFIDLLMVTIAFLLVTAVWTQMARIEADAQVPGAGPARGDDEARLHVEMTDPSKIVLHWNVGRTVVRTREVPRWLAAESGGPRFPELAAALGDEWRAAGSHRLPSDGAFDEIVLHTANDARYAEIVGAMDAAHAVERECSGGKRCSAFRVVFAAP
jgi:biopolymer transport protein ExbD